MIHQTPDRNFATAALDLLADGKTETPEGVALAEALKGTRILQLIGGVSWEIKSRAHFDRETARSVLKTERGRQLFDELVAEALVRVRWRKKGRLAVIAMASAIALQADEVAQ